jgi:adenylyltransferase/sulfurtransferase
MTSELGESMKYNIEGFDEKELEYYSRQIVLPEIGLNGQRKLKDARVCIIGLGGLGSPISIQLASMGVGYLKIVDRDIVEISNLQRQHLYDMDMVGYPKVEAAAKRLRKLNPFVEVMPTPLSLTPRNAEEIISGMDVVVDGLDRMAPRYAINRACVKLGIPYVFGAAITHVGNISTIIPGKTACLECFLGNVDDDQIPSCAVVGVHPSIINIVASVQVSEVVRLITGKAPNLTNVLLFCDLEDMSFEKVHLARVDACPVCGSKPSSHPKPLKLESVEEICGREGRRVFVFTPESPQCLDLDYVNSQLTFNGFSINLKGDLGSTFSKGVIKGSILKSGVTILEGTKDINEARKIQKILLKF